MCLLKNSDNFLTKLKVIFILTEEDKGLRIEPKGQTDECDWVMFSDINNVGDQE